MFRSASTAETDELSSLALFSNLSAKELSSIIKQSSRRVFKGGDRVVEQGELSNECYVIIEGTATVEIDGAVVCELGAGESFGELAPIDGQPRSASVVAVHDLVVLVFSAEQFSAVASSFPAFTRRILSEMTVRLRSTQV